MNIRRLIPEGAVRLLDFRDRFRSLGQPGHWCLARAYREALELSCIELMPRDLLSSLQCVVDVGANVGNWSIAIARLTEARHIIAYEPIPATFERLSARTSRYPQIRCIQAAIGDVVGETKINIEQVSELSSILRIRDEARGFHGLKAAEPRQVTVPLTTLDQELQDQDEVSLLKLDVQGYEPEVVLGARQVLQRTRILMTEVTYVPYYRGDRQFLDYANLIVSLSKLRLWCVSSPSFSKSGRPVLANAIFVRDTDSD